MTRTEYLETIEGQRHERLKRMIRLIYLKVNQEPKGKNCSDREKLFFRKEIKKQLRKMNRRPFRGDLILEIDYYTTQDNPPALQTLSKNYLDLLHKPMPHIDSYKGLLFKDDGQIKILISNYHVNKSGKQTPQIRIKAYRLGHFIKDIELADRILNNKFNDSNSFGHSRFENKLYEEDYYKSRDYYEDLYELERDKEFYDSSFGIHYHTMQKQFLLRQIQEQYLKQNSFGIRQLISIFQPYFSYYKIYSKNIHFQKLWDSSKKLIFFSSSFLDFGSAPQKSGDTNILKQNLKEELKRFKDKYKVLFPLLQPISILITFIPPKQKIIDLDNLARHIVPFVNEILKPPSVIQLTYDSKHFPERFKDELIIKQRFPPNSIASYQLVHLPRRENDPANGEIKFVITDGLYHMNNIWRTVDDAIRKWDNIFY